MKPARCLALLVPALSMLLAGACAPVSGPILAATPTPAAAMVEASVPVPLSPAAPPSPSPAASPALDSLTIALGSEPDTLHPLLGGWTERTIQAAIFSACTRENEKMEWAPEMCEQVPTLANGGAAWVGDGDQRHLEVTFRLRPDWRWHDGTAVTAADYVYTWKLALDPGLPWITDRASWDRIEEMAALDDRTLLVRYHNQATLALAATGGGRFPAMKQAYAAMQAETPAGPLINPFYYGLSTPVPAHVLASIPAKGQYDSEFNHKPLGNGPYRLTLWEPGRSIELAAVQDFPLGTPKARRVVFRFLPQDGTAVSLLRAGEVDLISTDGLLNADMAKELDGLAAAGFQVYRTPSSIWDHVDLNTTRFPFDDLRVRRALAYATGKQALAQQVHAGNVPVADSFLPETHWAYGGAGIQRYPYSLEDARALLAQAGWDCGKTPCTRQAANGTVEKLAFTLSTTDRADRQQIAQVLARQWAQAGFGVDVQILYGRGLFQPANQGGPLAGRNFDAALYTWVLGDNPAIDGLYACRSIPTKENGFTGLNYSGWCSPQSDAMVVSAGRDPDVLADRMRWRGLLAGVQAAWSADVPVIPLYHGVMISAARPGLRGYKPSLQPNSTELWNVWQWDVER